MAVVAAGCRRPGTSLAGAAAAASMAEPSKKSAASDGEHELYRSTLRVDILKLHELAAGAAGGGRIAARRGAAGPIEAQLSRALAGCLCDGGRAACLAPAAACGPLLELLLLKVAEAAAVGVEETDAGDGSLVAPAVKLRGLGSGSMVGPIVAALERLRWLHEVARSHAVRAAGQAPRIVLPSEPPPAVPERRPPSRPTSTVAVQTDLVAAPQPVAVVQRAGPPKPQVCAVSTQTEEASRRAWREAGVQVSLQPERRDAESQVEVVISHCSFAQTQGVSARTFGVQTEASRPSSRDARIQTEDIPAVVPQHPTYQTVRILRLARLDRRAAAGPEASEEPPGSGGGTGLGLRGSQSTPSLARPPVAPVAAPLPAVAQEDPPATAPTTGAGASAAQPLVLRCPAGHGLQWFRRRESFHDGLGGPGEVLSCSCCCGALGGPLGFHTCALCYRETGERYALCGSCSRERQSAAAGGDAALPRTGSRAAPLFGKSVSAGSLRSRPRPDLTTGRGREWSLVSAAGNAPPPTVPRTAVGRG